MGQASISAARPIPSSKTGYASMPRMIAAILLLDGTRAQIPWATAPGLWR